jgi:hypothetical protein
MFQQSHRAVLDRRSWLKNGNPVGRPEFRPSVRRQDPPRHGVSVPGNGKRKVPYARGVPVPGSGPPKGWRGRTVHAGNMGFILPRSAQKRARELLTQSRELLKQMQAG